MKRFRFLSFFIFLSLAVCVCSCNNESSIDVKSEKPSTKLPKENFQAISFDLLSPEKTGIDFNNKIDVLKVKTFLEYMNAYNGGGVAIGDVNNDGLEDIYFTGNTSSNKLYLNKGDFKFEDVSKSAGIEAKGKWCTGTTMVDINKDGLLDIYVCVSYLNKPEQRQNLLYINNGDLTFTESAKAYGINDTSYGIEAVFLDYDKDNDLDLYVANHGITRMGITFEAFYDKWKNPPEALSDRLYKNNGDGTFTDVTKEAGVFNYGFSLSVSVSDFNNDGWLDIYNAVDHAEPDVYFENNKDGTFTNVIYDKMKHISFSSMGTDAADINNDGLIDLYCVDMLSENNYRNKAQMGDMNPDFFWDNAKKGYHYSYMRNQLHLNIGDGHFSEIGQLAGVDKTDWSWSPLFVDFNNNGYKDLFITNGYLLDIMDKDSRKKLDKEVQVAFKERKDPKKVFMDFTLGLTSTRLANYCYHNNGDLTFKDVSSESGLNFNGFSSGGAYADLDNDGDLDLIISNINDPAFVYENKAEKNGNHYLTVRLNNENKIEKIGTRVYLTMNDGIQVQEFIPVRGYQSSVSHLLHFGLGAEQNIKEIKVVWTDGKTQVLKNQKVDQTISLNYSDAHSMNTSPSKKIVFKEANSIAKSLVKHVENDFDDYEKQVLLPHKMSQFGPHVSKGDVNADGLTDVFVGGASNQSGQIYLQKGNGQFELKRSKVFEKDKICEDYGSVFFDADGDKDLDLYVVSGGNEFEKQHANYQDRLYLNDGFGNFEKGKLPEITSSGSVVLAEDLDADGDIDLFVGGRQVPGQYPKPARSNVMLNDNGQFTILQSDVLNELGMVTDAVSSDIDGDGKLEIVVVGEWMPITVLGINGDLISNKSAALGVSGTNGWWNCITPADFNGDGKEEFILGNLGLNYKYRASKEKPFMVYGNDFDQNGNYDIVLSYSNDEGTFPLRGRQCSSEQIPEIAEDFKTYDQFAKASLADVYGDKLNSSLHYRIEDFRSAILKPSGNGYELEALPSEAQLSPVFGAVAEDFDKDGHQDFVIGGNLFSAEVETGRADAGIGYFFKGDGKGGFKVINGKSCGFYIPGDVKDIEKVDNYLFVGNNNDHVQVFTFD